MGGPIVMDRSAYLQLGCSGRTGGAHRIGAMHFGGRGGRAFRVTKSELVGLRCGSECCS